MLFLFQDGLLLVPRTNDWPKCGRGIRGDQVEHALNPIQ